MTCILNLHQGPAGHLEAYSGLANVIIATDIKMHASIRQRGNSAAVMTLPRGAVRVIPPCGALFAPDQVKPSWQSHLMGVNAEKASVWQMQDTACQVRLQILSSRSLASTHKLAAMRAPGLGLCHQKQNSFLVLLTP